MLARAVKARNAYVMKSWNKGKSASISLSTLRTWIRNKQL